MNRVHSTPRVVATALGGFCFLAACLGACSDDRATGFNSVGAFADDAASPDCRIQCSLDGRSVIEACTGKVVEACSDELACGAGKCQEPCAAAAADRSSNGCEFYFQMPLMDKQHIHGCHAVFVVNTSTKPADVSLESNGRSLDISNSMFQTRPGSSELNHHVGPIPPGESVILFVSDSAPGTPMPPYAYYVACPEGTTPATFEDTVPHKTGIGTSLRLTANVPVALTSMYPFGGAASYIPSATLVLPVSTWAKEHMVVNGWTTGNAGAPAVQIVASEDETDVTIVPKVDILDGPGVVGVQARKSATYRLNRGQHLQIVQDRELSGSVVTSTKPTSLFGGQSCAYIPSSASACDILSQQIPAFEQWGSEYVGVGYRPRMGNEHEPVPYRIVAARDGTQLDYDPEIPPGAPTTMSAGEVATFRRGTGDAFVVRTQDVEHPIYVSAHMTGGNGDGRTAPSFDGFGDPEFVNVVPAKQYLNAYSFYADPTYAETSLVVVRRAIGSEFKDVWLECAGNLTGWKPIGTRGEYEFVRIDLSIDHGPGETFGEGLSASVCRTGLQRMRSEGPFTATLWGWDAFASYAYTGGQAQRKLVETSLTVQ